MTKSVNEEVFENVLPEPEVDHVAPTIVCGKELGDEVSEPEVVGDNSGRTRTTVTATQHLTATKEDHDTQSSHIPRCVVL